MNLPVIDVLPDTASMAELNRHLLDEAEVLAISISGGPGSGKTSLIDATLQRLASDVHIGVIACDVTSHLDADRIMRGSSQVVQVNTGERGMPDAGHIHDAIQSLDLKSLDLLLIENVGTLVGSAGIDLGQHLIAALFSVAGGHDKADKHPDLVQAADVVLLNKVDLLTAVPFNLPAFRADVHRLNPDAELIELSALRGQGMDRWIEWLRLRARNGHKNGQSKTSEWFG